jgi:hydrogenase/urease accessory protein HupE
MDLRGRACRLVLVTGQRLWAAVAAGAIVLAVWPASGHRLAPSLLEVSEHAPGELEVLWKTPLQTPVGGALGPQLPAACRATGEPVSGVDGSAATLRWRAACGPQGLVGRSFGVEGLAASRTEALLRVELADGRRVQAVLRAAAPTFVVPERQGALDVAGDYLAFGVRHILSGLDHLLFVLALVLLIHVGRTLFWTVTCFTLGHSVTLSLAILGVIGLPSGLVEIAIAASILLLAVELARGDAAERSRDDAAERSLLRRAPWAMAALFGLVHGLGFAGALAEAGLPQEEIPLALFSFNVGIELGQLAFVLAVLLARRWLRPLYALGPDWLARAPAYGIGTLAAYWIYQRAWQLL